VVRCDHFLNLFDVERSTVSLTMKEMWMVNVYWCKTSGLSKMTIRVWATANTGMKGHPIAKFPTPLVMVAFALIEVPPTLAQDSNPTDSSSG
jgi:hypothetical protein